MPAQRTGRGRGRPPGESQTRQAILDAAREQFAENGWKGATLRAIARDAGVDATLVVHYFGSKRKLFAAAMEWPFGPEDAVDQIVPGPRREIGRRLAAFFVSIWEDPGRRAPIMTMLRAGTTNADAAAVMRETLAVTILGPVGERLDLPDADLRMSLCSAQLIGAGIARYVLRLEPLASLEPSDFTELLAPALQHYMTAQLGG